MLRSVFLVPLLLAATALQAQPAAPAPTADPVRRVGIAEAGKALADGTALFVDVRGASDYAQAHVKGALHIPAGEIGARAKELPRDRFIITYCT
jgi:hypothetical protein